LHGSSQSVPRKPAAHEQVPSTSHRALVPQAVWHCWSPTGGLQLWPKWPRSSSKSFTVTVPSPSMSSGAPTDPKAASSASRSPTSTRKSPVRSKQSDRPGLREARGGSGQLVVKACGWQTKGSRVEGADSCARDRSASTRHAPTKRIAGLLELCTAPRRARR
jgi:hypothetical protein